MTDIQRFFRENVEQKKLISGTHTFIAAGSFYEFQMDLFCINALENLKLRVWVILGRSGQE